MLRSIRCFLILSACYLMQACTTLQPRAPVCSPPPIPEHLTLPCPDLPPVKDGKLATLYQQMLEDAALYRQCQRLHDQMVAVVQYREKVCDDINRSHSSRPWWKFWAD